MYICSDFRCCMPTHTFRKKISVKCLITHCMIKWGRSWNVNRRSQMFMEKWTEKSGIRDYVVQLGHKKIILLFGNCSYIPHPLWKHFMKTKPEGSILQPLNPVKQFHEIKHLKHTKPIFIGVPPEPHNYFRNLLALGLLYSKLHYFVLDLLFPVFTLFCIIV